MAEKANHFTHFKTLLYKHKIYTNIKYRSLTCATLAGRGSWSCCCCCCCSPLLLIFLNERGPEFHPPIISGRSVPWALPGTGGTLSHRLMSAVSLLGWRRCLDSVQFRLSSSLSDSSESSNMTSALGREGERGRLEGDGPRDEAGLERLLPSERELRSFSSSLTSSSSSSSSSS